jgi:hypothetical protein
MRHRSDLVQMTNPHIQHMHKALTTYPITTVTNRRECGYPAGQRLTANPPMFTFTIGTIN